MPDELKIQISAPGAAETTAALGGVAAGEAQVAGQAGKAAGSAADLGGKNVMLLNTLRMMGPEFRLTADAISVLVNNQVGATMALGLLAVALMAVKTAYDSYTASQTAQKQRAAEMKAQIEEQIQDYVELERAIDASMAAEGRGRRPPAPQPEVAILRAAVEARDLGVSKGVVQEAAVLAADESVSDAEVGAYERWLALGLGERFGTPALARRAFKAQFASDPGLGARLEAEYAAFAATRPASIGTGRRGARRTIAGIVQQPIPDLEAAGVGEYLRSRGLAYALGRPEVAEPIVRDGAIIFGSYQSGGVAYYGQYADPSGKVLRRAE